MNNPSVTFVTVTTTPAVLFQGGGKVEILLVGPFSSVVWLGDVNVNPVSSPPNQWGLLNGVGAKFNAEFTVDAELYAVCSSGTQQVKIVRWF